jgi:hypothetical protein
VRAKGLADEPLNVSWRGVFVFPKRHRSQFAVIYIYAYTIHATDARELAATGRRPEHSAARSHKQWHGIQNMRVCLTRLTAARGSSRTSIDDMWHAENVFIVKTPRCCARGRPDGPFRKQRSRLECACAVAACGYGQCVCVRKTRQLLPI